MAERTESHMMILVQVGTTVAAVVGAMLLTVLCAALRLALDAAFDFSSPTWPLIIGYLAPHLGLVAVYILVYRRLPELTETHRNRVIALNTTLNALVLFAGFCAGVAASLYLSKGLFLMYNAVLDQAMFRIDDIVLAATLFGSLYMGPLYVLLFAVYHRRL